MKSIFWMRGTELHTLDKQHVLCAYVHRFTGQFTPNWATRKTPLQFKDDADWLANTFFAVTGKGRLDKRVKHCQSNPTWPNGIPAKLKVA